MAMSDSPITLGLMLHGVSQSNMQDNHTTPSLADQQTVDNMKFYFSGIVQLIVCIIGLVCNALVIIVFTQKTMKTSTNIYLLSLAIFDSVILVCTTLILCLPPLSATYANMVHPRILPYLYPIALTAQTFTIWITVSFTVERHMVISNGFKYRGMNIRKRTSLVVLFNLLFAIAYNITRWLEFESVPVQKYIDGRNVTTYKIQYKEFESSPMYNKVYYTILYLPIMNIIPMLILMIFNTLIIVKIRRAYKQRKLLIAEDSAKEANVSLILVAVVVVFIICQTPALIYNVRWEFIRNKTVPNTIGWKILSQVRNFTVNFNSAINFILYCAIGKKFRAEFKSVFCHSKIKHHSLSRNVQTTLVSITDQNSNQYPMITSMLGADAESSQL